MQQLTLIDDLHQLKVPENQRPSALSDNIRLRWVPEYEEKYAVTDDGRVFSYCSGVMEMSLCDRGNGYPCVKLAGTVVDVHRLVCRAFRGPPPSEEHEVRHLDGSRDNNRVENLRWGTRAENVQDSLQHGTFDRSVTWQGEEAEPAKLTAEEVREIRQRYQESSETQAEIAEDYPITKSTVSDITRGAIWTHL